MRALCGTMVWLLGLPLVAGLLFRLFTEELPWWLWLLMFVTALTAALAMGHVGYDLIRWVARRTRVR